MSEQVPIDPAEAVLDGCSTGVCRPVGRVLLYFSSLGTGGCLGSLGERLARLVESPSEHNLFRLPRAGLDGLEWIFEGFLSSAFPLVGAGLAFFLFTQRDLAWWWFASVVLHAMLWLGDDNASAVGWVSGVLLCGMTGTALWFARAWQHNRWAREMAELQAENASRIAARERAQEAGDALAGQQPGDP